MTTSELAVIVTLGAVIGVPMQAPDRGMVAAGLILLLALLFQRGLGLWTFHSQRVEQITMGDVVAVVEDGRLLTKTLRQLVLSRERLFSVLRAGGVEHLGELRRVYVEVTGDFSVYKFKRPKPGLSILPIFDQGLRDHFRVCPKNFVCNNCGAECEEKSKPAGECRHCDQEEWVEAVEKMDSED